MKHYSIKVYGKVQGVFYRASTLRVATQLGIVGWVKNELDGSVSIVAEADQEALDRLLDWCRSGPEYASVNKVDCEESQLINFDSFSIIR